MQKTTHRRQEELEPIPQRVYELLGPRPGSRGTKDQTCGTCRMVNENRPGIHVCRKEAPISFQADRGGLMPLWPRVRLDDWCKQWRDNSQALNSKDPAVLEYERRARELFDREQTLESARRLGAGKVGTEEGTQALARLRKSIDLGHRANFPHRLPNERTDPSTDAMRHGFNVLLSAHRQGIPLQSAEQDPDTRRAIARWPWAARAIFGIYMQRERYHRQHDVVDEIKRRREAGDETGAEYMEGVESIYALASLREEKWDDLSDELKGYASEFPDIARAIWKDFPKTPIEKAKRTAGLLLAGLGIAWASWTAGRCAAPTQAVVSFASVHEYEAEARAMSRLVRQARRDAAEASGAWDPAPLPPP